MGACCRCRRCRCCRCCCSAEGGTHKRRAHATGCCCRRCRCLCNWMALLPMPPPLLPSRRGCPVATGLPLRLAMAALHTVCPRRRVTPPPRALLPSPAPAPRAARYHSLVIEKDSCPEELEVTAWCASVLGVPMPLHVHRLAEASAGVRRRPSTVGPGGAPLPGARPLPGWRVTQRLRPAPPCPAGARTAPSWRCGTSSTHTSRACRCVREWVWVRGGGGWGGRA